MNADCYQPWRNPANLRTVTQGEVDRIGVEEFALRLKVSKVVLSEFLAGGDPPLALRTALSVYDFGEYPDLRKLMDGYFHDSYDEDTGSPSNWQSAVDDFVYGNSRGIVLGAASDIRLLLQAFTEEAGLHRLLIHLGCCFAFRSIKMDVSEWLEAVHDRLQASATPPLR